jgi:hypothetical protein
MELITLGGVNKVVLLIEAVFSAGSLRRSYLEDN